MKIEARRAHSGPTRRKVLAGMLGIGGLAMLPGCGPEEPARPKHEPDELRAIPERNTTVVAPNRYPEMDLDKVMSALENLRRAEEQTGDKEHRHKAIESSLRIITIGGDPDSTALQIDKSGLYLTAGHTIGSDAGMAAAVRTGIQILNPYTGIANPAREAYADHDADIGIIYAPTGEDQSPVPGIVLDFATPEDDEELTLLSTLPTHNMLFIDSGMVDLSRYQPHEPFVRVESMIPYGGTSGGSVVDSDYRIRGILSGAYRSHEVNVVENYEGANVVLIGQAIGSLTATELYP